MKYRNILSSYLVILFIFLLPSCQQDKASSLSPLNLLEYGVPLTILAPDSAEVKTMDLIVQKDITIKGKDNYAIQISVSDATTTNIQKILSEQRESVKSGPYFSKFISEDENGFIYESIIDSTHINYDFRYVRVRGDKEYIFQTGILGTFSLPDVERMYIAVQPPKTGKL